MKKKTYYIFVACFILSACDFSINDYPGSQRSSSVKESKKHGTFICEYRVKGNIINHVKIETIFAENIYSRKTSFLYPKQIDCYNSQLIIFSSDQIFSTQTSGYDIDWKILGFSTPAPYASLIYRVYKGTLLPDSIPITVVAIKGNDTSKVIQKLTIYKIHEK